LTTVVTIWKNESYPKQDIRWYRAMRSTIQSGHAATNGLLLVISVVLKGTSPSMISTIRMLTMKLVPSVPRVINQDIPRIYTI